nr:hypothetical protein [Methanobrevibacter arboriphilus]
MSDIIYSENELEDKIAACEKSMKNQIRKLGSEKVINGLLKHGDLSVCVPNFKSIREQVLDTYAKDKEPDFLEDLQNKSDTAITRLEENIEDLKKDIRLHEKELRAISHNLDDYQEKSEE